MLTHQDYAATAEKYAAYSETDDESIFTEEKKKRSMNEFSAYLHDLHLHSDDVPGILKVRYLMLHAINHPFHG
jgi:hypothetical protein